MPLIITDQGLCVAELLNKKVGYYLLVSWFLLNCESKWMKSCQAATERALTHWGHIHWSTLIGH